MTIQLDAPRYPRCPQDNLVLLCQPSHYEFATRVLHYGYTVTCLDCGHPHADAVSGCTDGDVYDIANEFGLRVKWGERALEDLCRHDLQGVEVSIAVNGVTYYRWACANRECRKGRRLKKREAESMLSRGVLQVAGDDRRRNTPPCERCDSTDGTELHHYAPWSLFDDADEWATGYLCRSCHTEWHERTRTGSYATAR